MLLKHSNGRKQKMNDLINRENTLHAIGDVKKAMSEAIKKWNMRVENE